MLLLLLLRTANVLGRRTPPPSILRVVPPKIRRPEGIPQPHQTRLRSVDDTGVGTRGVKTQ